MKVMWSGEWHPLAERFPMLDEGELREMAASIAERGQYVPCQMTPDGLGLDGRNRVAASALAGVDPVWQVYKGDPVPFIVEVNAERRHLTTGQRAMAVAIGLVEAGKRRNGAFDTGSKPREPRSASRSAWEKALQLAGTVLDYAPEHVNDVLAGGLELGTAYREADKRRDARKRIDALGGELAALVDNGVIDVAEAERRAKDEQRLGQLVDELANRVRAGDLGLDEAEVISAANRARVAAWAEEIRAALITLARMAGHPVPDDLAEHLSTEERRDLTEALAALSTSKEE